MNKTWKTTAGAALLVLAATTAPAWAETPAPEPVPFPKPVLIMAPAETSTGAISLTGEVTYVDLEGGYYAVGGWMLKGDPASFKPFLGKAVTVTGTRFDGFSIQMVRAINVSDIQLATADAAPSFLMEIPATRAYPPIVTVNGETVLFDQQPIVIDGTLMIPLRAIVEAAGGTIGWDETTRSVTVRLSDRSAAFVIGSDEAEMNEDGVMYLMRNMIKMARPATIIEGRTMISADALTNILGLLERPDRDLKLDLMPGKQLAAAEIALVQRTERSAAPAALTEWAASVGEASGSKAISTKEGTYVAIAGGMQNSGGWRIEIVGDAVKRSGVWVIDARVVPPTGFATMALENPVDYFFLPGVEGDVEVQFIAEPLPKAER